MSNPRERVSLFTDVLSNHDLPFHWKRCDSAANLYHGKPFTVNTKILIDLKDLLDSLCEHEISYGFGDDTGRTRNKKSIQNLLLVSPAEIEREIAKKTIEVHEEDEMVAFYDAFILREKLIIRSTKLS